MKKLEKEELKLENSLKKEWLITNGIGGFASSTVIGCNTRKYHGLLIAPFAAPGRRRVILSKVDESLEIEGKKYNLYTNMANNYITDGYKYQEDFEKDYIPIFTYKVEDIEIKKLICMEYGKNTVCILYKIISKDKGAKLTLAPIMNNRDFHQMNTNHNFTLKQTVNKQKVVIIIDNQAENPVYINASEGNYIQHYNDNFNNMYYLEEEKRGFYPEENLVVPGRYEIDIEPNQEKEISFVCSLEDNIEELDVKRVINDEIIRIRKLINSSGLYDLKVEEKYDVKYKEFIQEYIIATDNFVVYRPNFRLHTLIAGYPWFLDWARDSLISFEGTLLIPKRYEIAKEVLLTLIRDIKFGLVPNGYSGFDLRPLYNSADASLLLFEAIYKYLNYTNDMAFVKGIYARLKVIIKSYIEGIDIENNNIYLDDDYLIVSGTPQTQNTWMDAKYGDFAFTPRNGKAVEINALWYNALKIMQEFANTCENKEESNKYKELAEYTKISFTNKFYNKRRKCLYDVLGDGKIRPNQLFSLSLSHPVIDPDSEIAKNMISVIDKKILTEYGLRTLAKGEPDFVEIYEGDSFKRDASYHQGPAWPWLLGLYYDALKNMIKKETGKTNKQKLTNKLEEFCKTTEKVFLELIDKDGVIGSIGEIYDTKPPFASKGAPAQCWSVAEVFRIILRK